MSPHHRNRAWAPPVIALAAVMVLAGCSTPTPPQSLATPTGGSLTLPNTVMDEAPGHVTEATAPHPVVVAPPAPQAPARKPSAPGPSASLSQGPVHDNSNYYYSVSLAHFGAGATVSVTCYGSADPGNTYTLTFVVDGNGASPSKYVDSNGNGCFSGSDQNHWVIANGVRSNTVNW